MPHAIVDSSPWIYDSVHADMSPNRRSIFGSIRKLARKNSKSSLQSTTTTMRFAQNMGRTSPRPFVKSSPATRRPDPSNMNPFSASSNEPPPAYTPSSTGQQQPSELPSPVPAPTYPPQQSAAGDDESPYSFLSTFDTTLLIDDSGSMAGRSWREVSEAISTIAPIVTQHDNDGIDVYFLNHKSNDIGVVAEGVAPTGYRGIRRAATVTEIFQRVRPSGGTPTGTRIHQILKPYLANVESEMALGREVKPLNLIVLTDGVPSDDVESVLLHAAKKLDKLEAPPFQVGVQFFQVGNERGAREALQELDDELGNLVEGGVRDMVDTVTFTGGASALQGGMGLTGEGILKAVLGAVVRRLDRRRASGDVSRSH
ncbi:von willebrand factor [Phlyctema vagabunda]|uniref:von willebrand factor n=1 Tax=Phlyctema vagabunda TaxID=108571 RepID=A0ABR4PMV7_9HELO